nr:immunoglobulin heavy chain junction region [Macaca mulatta]
CARDDYWGRGPDYL